MIGMRDEAKRKRAAADTSPPCGAGRTFKLPGTGITVSAAVPIIWKKDRRDLMAIENTCFHPMLRASEEWKETRIASRGVVAAFARDGRRIVGETYGGPIEERHKPEEGDMRQRIDFDRMFGLYKKMKGGVFYTESLAVMPEYRGMGVGTALKGVLFMKLRRMGYEVAVGHANSGDAMEINRKFGAKVCGYYRDWCGTGETHYLYEVDLRLMRITDAVKRP